MFIPTYSNILTILKFLTIPTTRQIRSLRRGLHDVLGARAGALWLFSPLEPGSPARKGSNFRPGTCVSWGLTVFGTFQKLCSCWKVLSHFITHHSIFYRPFNVYCIWMCHMMYICQHVLTCFPCLSMFKQYLIFDAWALHSLVCPPPRGCENCFAARSPSLGAARTGWQGAFEPLTIPLLAGDHRPTMGLNGNQYYSNTYSILVILMDSGVFCW